MSAHRLPRRDRAGLARTLWRWMATQGRIANCSAIAGQILALAAGLGVLVGVAGASSPALADPTAVVLTGNYLQVGISPYGTFGSGGSTEPGILHDPTGTQTFYPNGIPNDYLTPGDPHDGFAINSTQTGLIVNDNDGSGTSFGTASPTLLTGAAAKGYTNAATWTGTYESLLTITNTYYFNANDEQIHITTTITALANLTSVAFGRSEDPDPDVNAFGTFDTVNTRGDATTAPQDLVSAAGQNTGLTIGILNESGNTFAHNTDISDGCCSNEDPYDVLASTNTIVYPNTNVGDYGLQIAWNLGDLAAGQSVEVDYSYVFGTHQGSVSSSQNLTIDTTSGDIAPNVFSLGSAAATGSIVEFNGGTLRLTGGSFANNIITAPVTIDATNGTVDTNAGNGGFSGVVSGPGSLTIMGGGVFSLTGANTYSGGTIVQGATVQVNNSTLDSTGAVLSSSLGTGPLTLSGGTLQATVDGLTLGNAATLAGTATIDTETFGLTYAGPIGGTGQLVKVGSGTLTLTGADSHSGGTLISAGTLQVGNGGTTGTLSGDVVDNAALVFDRADSLTVSGTLSGTGSLTQNGSGTLILTGANAYSGGTTIEAGVIGVGNASALGTGGVTFAGGTLQQAIGAGATFAVPGAVQIASASATIDLNGGAIEIDHAISGTGALVVTDSGSGTGDTVFDDHALRLNATNSYSGGTIVQSGAGVEVLAANGLGTGSLTVLQGGQIVLSGVGQTVTTLTGGGVIAASGPETVTDGSTTTDILSVQSGAFSGQLLDKGRVLLDADGSQTTVNHGSLQLVKVSDGSASGGTLTLSGQNTYSGATQVQGGTLQAGSATAFSANSDVTVAAAAKLDLGGFSNSIGSLAGGGTVTNSGSVAATLTAGGTNTSTTFSGSIADGIAPTAFTKTGTGTMTLTGSNTYSGGTALEGGTLEISNSQALGTGALSMDDDTTLRFVADGLKLANAIVLSTTEDPTIDTGSGNETLSGAISGPGALTKLGSGTLDLTGNSTYTGATTVEAGTLQVDGSTASSVLTTIAGGAVLSGNGTVGSVMLSSGAVVAPAAGATLKIAGDLTFGAGSTYQATINPDGTTSAIAVTGTASLAGAGLTVLAGSGTFSAHTYEILTASQVTGTFAPVTFASNLALLRPTVSYGTGDVTVTLNPVAFDTLAATSNQRKVATAIQALGSTSPLYNAVLNSTDDRTAQQAFGAASGVSHASAVTAQVEVNRLVTGLVFDRLWDIGGSGPDARQLLEKLAPDSLPALVRCYAPAPSTTPTPAGYTAWGEAFGDFGHNSNGNAGSLDRSLGGFVAGIDHPVPNISNGVAGFAVGYSNTSFTSHLDGGSGTVESAYAVAYGGARWGAIDVRVGATGGATFNETHRTVMFAGFLDHEHSKNDGTTLGTFGEVGYRIPMGRFILEPVAGAAVTYVQQDGFREHGGAAALVGDEQDDTVATTTLGARGEIAPFKDVALTARGFLGWQHAFGDVNPATTLAFASDVANSFTVAGAPIDRDALAAEAALDWRASAVFTLGLSYTGLYSATASDNAVKGHVDYRF